MAQTRRMGKRNRRADRPKAPRPPTQASARPSLKSVLTERRGRDVGFAESGFRPTLVGKIMRTDPPPFARVARLLKLNARPAVAGRSRRRQGSFSNLTPSQRLGIRSFPLMNTDRVSIRIKNGGHMAPRKLHRFDDEPASTLLQFPSRRFKILDLQRD
jgi:hypothetical protein